LIRAGNPKHQEQHVKQRNIPQREQSKSDPLNLRICQVDGRGSKAHY